jgi:hypothetical protein
VIDPDIEFKVQQELADGTAWEKGIILDGGWKSNKSTRPQPDERR